MALKHSLAALTVLAVFAAAGCNNQKEAEKAVPENKPAPVVRAEEPRSVPAATPPASRSQTLQACLKEHSAADRKYCECFAEHMNEGRGAPASAMACKNLRAANR